MSDRAEKGGPRAVHLQGGDTIMRKALLTLVVTLASMVAAANIAGACFCVFYQPDLR